MASIKRRGRVAARGEHDLWTVGRYDQGSLTYPLIEQWDGRRWSIVQIPVLGQVSDLDSVTALASNNVWAVGYYRNNSQAGPLFEQWNGKQWNMVPGPNERSWFLVGVAALNAQDLWAVGSTTGNTLIMHYC